jgi:hypothetical protein
VPSDLTVESAAEKLSEMKAAVATMSPDYFAAVDSDRQKMERALEEEAARGAAERENDESNADKDSRRLPKAERMRKVTKHKETGNELFKGKNYMHAAKHYKGAGGAHGGTLSLSLSHTHIQMR